MIWCEGVSKSGLLPAAIAALLASPAAAGASSTLLPGVTYQRQVRMISGAPVVVHIVRAPRHGGNYRLRPVLSHNTVRGSQTVPDMQRSLRRGATTVGVNGDFFNLARGWPSGVFLRNGVLATKPNKGRSALGIAFDGTLLVENFGFRGSWRAGSHRPNPLREVNRQIQPGDSVGLYTPAFGGPTPRLRGVREVVLSGFPRTLLNGYLQGTVRAVRRGGGTWVPPGGAVLQARGAERTRLLAEARIGTTITVRLRMPRLPTNVADAIGGGPALVRDGLPVRHADEWFTLAQLVPRHPRAAVGQLRNGRVIFVVVDGRSRQSFGLTMWDMSRLMASLGARTAMNLDGGGSATIAFDGRVLNRPSDGQPRPVSTALFVHYYGIYAPPIPGPPLSPNGDGVSESKVVSAKVVRRSAVDLRLLRPNGTVAWRYHDTVGRGRITRRVGSRAMVEGRWRWVTAATDVQSGRTSRMGQAFSVNRTLGHLRLSKEWMRVRVGRGGRLDASAALTRQAFVKVTVRSSSGRVVRLLFRGSAGRGRHAWRWNGRNASWRVVPTGTYSVVVTARNGLGTVALAKRVHVTRVG